MQTNPRFQPYLMGRDQIRAPGGSRLAETDAIEGDLRQERGEGREGATHEPCRHPQPITPPTHLRAPNSMREPPSLCPRSIPQPPSDPAPRPHPPERALGGASSPAPRKSRSAASPAAECNLMHKKSSQGQSQCDRLNECISDSDQ